MQNTAVAIVEKLKQKGFEAYFAGGCVRDLILKKEPEDFDIATSATPDQIEKLFQKTFPIGKHFGVILIEENKHHFEIATFRSDSGYSDGRRPKYVTFTDAREDALRRDFTINGIFYDPINGEYYDFVDGTKDLKRGLLRFIGDPEKRIQEDHLRILRAVRFKNRFKLVYKKESRDAIKKHAFLILGVSAERIREELNKMLLNPNRRKCFEDLDKLRVLRVIMPSVHKLKQVPQPKECHNEGDVFAHTMQVLEHLPLNPSSELCWAALLHDVGKTETMKYRDGRIRFLHHQEIGLLAAKTLLKKLKFSRASIEKITWLIHHHHIFDQFHQMSKTTRLHYFDNPHFADLLNLHHADLMGSTPLHMQNRRAAENIFFEIKAEYKTAHIERALPSYVKELLTGAEIMGILNIPAGPQVGRIKEKMRELQLEKKVKTKDEAIKVLKNHR